MGVADKRIRRWLAGLALCLVSLVASGALVAQDRIEPKIVLQTLPYGGIEVAAWSLDDRYVLTANSVTRNFLIWDSQSGIIIDRLTLPSDNPDASLSVRRLNAMELSPDGKKAVVHGEAVYATPDDPAGTHRLLRYEIDLDARTVSLTAIQRAAALRAGRNMAAQTSQRIAANAALASAPDFETISQAAIALGALYEGTGGIDFAKAAETLPPLPKSNDGKRQLLRDPAGLVIENEDKTTQQTQAERNVRYSDVQLSPDGIMLAMVQYSAEDTDGKPQTTIDLFNTEVGLFQTPIVLPGDYSQVQWVFDDKLLVSQASDSNDRKSSNAWAKGAPPPVVGIDVLTGATEWQVDARCFVTPAASFAGVFGTGLASCRHSAGSDTSLQRLDLTSNQWQPFGELKLDKGTIIETLSVSAGGNVVAVSTLAADGSVELVAMDGASGKITGRAKRPDLSFIGKLSAYDDGGVFVSGDGQTAFWLPELGEQGFEQLPLQSVITKMAETDGQVIAVAGLIDDSIARWNLETDQAMPPLDFPSVIAGGFLPNRPVFWAFSALEGLRYWNTADWSEMMTLHFFTNSSFLAITPEGRYDTNLGPDAKQFRWLVPDRPYQSLSAQTFMRDYFQPGLIERMSRCSLEGDCKTAFKPLPAIAELNRTLPIVTITDVRAGATPDEAIVTIEIREGTDLQAPNGKTRSGIFNPRVFRDFRFAAHTPDSDFELDQSLARWREVNRMPDEDDAPGDGVQSFEAQLYLPTATGTEEQFISAYAFNEDRIKSDTAHYVYTRPAMTPRQPRAFVISIGVDRYREERLKLSYAANDARVMSERLSAIPGYETRRVVAVSGSDGRGNVTADTVRYLLAMLAGDIERQEALAFLKADGVDASALDAVGPDDVVIITYSGHGWTEKQGDFYLLPSDAKWPDGDEFPDVASLISSSELTMWLRLINAADIALIIDACHSGASVDNGNFKPGPMGDAGLGQLAYDKGIRILAATQADGLALETSKLKHGLLTFALAGNGEGLTRTDNALDLDGDSNVSLSEWLAYPAWRLLDFDDDERLTDLDTASDDAPAFAFPNRNPVRAKKVQQPSLFDFTAPSTVTVKALAP